LLPVFWGSHPLEPGKSEVWYPGPDQKEGYENHAGNRFHRRPAQAAKGAPGGCKLLPFLPSSISAVKLSHWARKHGMGYLTAWRSACGRCGKRLARDQAKRALEAMCG